MSSERLDQLRDLLNIQERMNRLFEDAVRQHHANEASTAVWLPAVDIFETELEVVLKAELPEVRQEDIQIQVENDKLTIRGERRLPIDLKQEQFHRIERVYGPFARSFALPQNTDREKIHAEFQQGVLTITMPKLNESPARQITIKIGCQLEGN
jgi:HSP20 family protein